MHRLAAGIAAIADQRPVDGEDLDVRRTVRHLPFARAGKLGGEIGDEAGSPDHRPDREARNPSRRCRGRSGRQANACAARARFASASCARRGAWPAARRAPDARPPWRGASSAESGEIAGRRRRRIAARYACFSYALPCLPRLYPRGGGVNAKFVDFRRRARRQAPPREWFGQGRRSKLQPLGLSRRH